MTQYIVHSEPFNLCSFYKTIETATQNLFSVKILMCNTLKCEEEECGYLAKVLSTTKVSSKAIMGLTGRYSRFCDILGNGQARNRGQSTIFPKKWQTACDWSASVNESEFLLKQTFVGEECVTSPKSVCIGVYTTLCICHKFNPPATQLIFSIIQCIYI